MIEFDLIPFLRTWEENSHKSSTMVGLSIKFQDLGTVKHIANWDRVVFKSDIIWNLLAWVKAAESSLARILFQYTWMNLYVPQFLICSCSELTWRPEHEGSPPMSPKSPYRLQWESIGHFSHIMTNKWKETTWRTACLFHLMVWRYTVHLPVAESALWQWELVLAYVCTSQKVEFRQGARPSCETSAHPQGPSIYQKS